MVVHIHEVHEDRGTAILAICNVATALGCKPGSPLATMMLVTNCPFPESDKPAFMELCKEEARKPIKELMS